MTAITPVTPDYTNDSGTAYPLNIDQGLASAQIVANQFQPHEAATPDMTVLIDSGSLMINGVHTAKTQQTTTTITAPVTNPRIDRIAIDITTGLYAIIAGTEAASPVAPGYPINSYPVCQVALATSTTQITNSLITDERAGINNIVEQGTWIPTIQDSSHSDGEGQTYGTQNGFYRKVGDIVYITGFLSITSLGTLTTGQQAVIGGLPYFLPNATNLTASINFSTGSNLSITALSTVTGKIDNNTNYIGLYEWDQTTGSSLLLLSQLTATASFSFSGTYLIS